LHQNTAYYFVIHGSRDPRPGQALQRLLQKLRAYFPEQTLMAGGALECTALPLADQLVEVAQQLASHATIPDHLHPDNLQLRVVPLFLLPGVHVKVDIPAAVDEAIPRCPPQVQLLTTPHLGAHPDLATLIAQSWGMPGAIPSTRLLLAHGSRRPGGNQAVATLAEQLQATPTFWATPPHLIDGVTEYLQTHPSPTRAQISIFPYFLFPGTILDAIMQTVDQLRQQFSAVDFYLERPLEVTDSLALLIRNLALSDLVLGDLAASDLAVKEPVWARSI
jgi:sirohydrochlorin cobaltochelatase